MLNTYGKKWRMRCGSRARLIYYHEAHVKRAMRRLHDDYIRAFGKEKMPCLIV